MTAPKKGDRAYVVDNMTGDLPTIRVRQVKRAGPRRVHTIGPGGPTQHDLVTTIGGAEHWHPAIFLAPEDALDAFIRAHEAKIESYDRQGRRAAAELSHARRLLDDYRAGSSKSEGRTGIASDGEYTTDGRKW